MGKLTSRAFGADEVGLDPLESGYEGVETDQDKARGNGQDGYGGRQAIVGIAVVRPMKYLSLDRSVARKGGHLRSRLRS